MILRNPTPSNVLAQWSHWWAWHPVKCDDGSVRWFETVVRKVRRGVVTYSPLFVK
jgi:hypothetical protein